MLQRTAAGCLRSAYRSLVRECARRARGYATDRAGPKAPLRLSDEETLATMPLVEVDSVLGAKRGKKWFFTALFGAVGYTSYQYVTLGATQGMIEEVTARKALGLTTEKLKELLEKLRQMTGNPVNWALLSKSKVPELAVMLSSDPNASIRAAAKQFLSVLAQTNDKGRLAIAQHLDLAQFVKRVLETNHLAYRQKTGYSFINKAVQDQFAEGVSDDILLCRLFSTHTLHDQLQPALGYVVDLLDDQDPVVRRTACIALYHLSETVTGRVLLAQTKAFPKLFHLRFDPDADVTLFDDGSEGQIETIRLTTKALQNMVLSQAAVNSLLEHHEAFMFALDKKAKEMLLNDFDYDRTKLLDNVWALTRGCLAASAFAMIWAPARYFKMYSRVGRRIPMPTVVSRAVNRAVPGSIAVYSSFALLTWFQNDYLTRIGVDDAYVFSMTVANFSAASLLGLITWMSPFTIVPAIVGGASAKLEQVIREVASETKSLGKIHQPSSDLVKSIPGPELRLPTFPPKPKAKSIEDATK